MHIKHGTWRSWLGPLHFIHHRDQNKSEYFVKCVKPCSSILVIYPTAKISSDWIALWHNFNCFSIIFFFFFFYFFPLLYFVSFHKCASFKFVAGYASQCDINKIIVIVLVRNSYISYISLFLHLAAFGTFILNLLIHFRQFVWFLAVFFLTFKVLYHQQNRTYFKKKSYKLKITNRFVGPWTFVCIRSIVFDWK